MNPTRFSLIFYKDFLRFLRAAHPYQYAQRIQFLRAGRAPPPNPLSPSPLQQNCTFAHKYGIIYAKKLYFCRFFVNCAKCGEQLAENPDRECVDERVFVLKKHSLSSLGEAKRAQRK